MIMHEDPLGEFRKQKLSVSPWSLKVFMIHSLQYDTFVNTIVLLSCKIVPSFLMSRAMPAKLTLLEAKQNKGAPQSPCK